MHLRKRHVRRQPHRQVDVAALLAHGVPYAAQDEVLVRVRYSARVAPWVLEHCAVDARADGSVVVEHRVADPRWLVRHVLGYGGEAWVEGPEVARGWLRAAL